MKTKKICKKCGKEFLTYFKRQIFCCDSCSHPKKIRLCVYCKKPLPENHNLHYQPIFCSEKCRICYGMLQGRSIEEDAKMRGAKCA